MSVPSKAEIGSQRSTCDLALLQQAPAVAMLVIQELSEAVEGKGVTHKVGGLGAKLQRLLGLDVEDVAWLHIFFNLIP